MKRAPSSETEETHELLYFWAIGDLHYRTLSAWNTIHTQRLAPMFEDLRALWQEEGMPAFYVSPGDLVETCAEEHYRLAKTSLETQLGSVPFYPGTGNHEFYAPGEEDPAQAEAIFSSVWQKPVRYTWQAGGVLCIMLDYPNPLTLADEARVFISQETLAFLDTALREHAHLPAVIFLHAPLYNTVLDRDPANYRDYNSLQHFFSPENSQEIRNILARHNNACLFVSGHTHSGWEAPNLICTENLGNHPVTFLNVMSPWYTGTRTGPRLSPDATTITYIPDEPDVITTFAVRVYSEHITIRAREHRTKQWLKEWTVPRSHL